MYLPEQIVRASSSSTGDGLEHRVLGQVAGRDARQLQEPDRIQLRHLRSSLAYASITTAPSTPRTVPAMLAWMRAPRAPFAGAATTSPARTRSPARTAASRRRPGVLLEREHDAPGREGSVLEGAHVPEAGEAQLRHQPPGRHAPRARERVRLHVLRPPREEEPLLPRDRLRRHADVLRVEVLRAGVQRAEVALAAERRAGDRWPRRRLKPRRRIARCGSIGWPSRYRGHSSVQKRHWSQAARPILLDLRRRRRVPADQRVVGREDDDPAGGLGDRLVEGRAGRPIITPPTRTATFGSVVAAGRRDHLADRRAHRHAERHRLRHGAGHGQELLGHRPAEADVHERLDVHDHGAHVAGHAAGRDHPPGDVVARG